MLPGQSSRGRRLAPAAASLVILLALFLAPSQLGAQPVTSEPSDPVADARVEDAVVEAITTRAAFDEAGTLIEEAEVRVRVNTPAGVQQAGTVVIPYRRDFATVDLHYVRVRKPDGTVVETPLTTTFDLPAPVTRTAPMYSDVFQRHVNVQALQPGDVLEYAWRLDEPSLIPGHFWFSGTLTDTQGSLEVSWPESRVPIVSSPGQEPVIETRDGRTIYRWEKGARAGTGDWADEGDDDGVTVLITSFADWAELGGEFRDLWQGRADPSPVVRARAMELTDGLETPEARARALYRFVATEIRYVGVAVGIGRYQPNPAEAVLASGFGDCKDKHVLLEALLRSVGIEAMPALIGPGGDVEIDVPTPDMFSHVVTFIPEGLADGPVWLDTTLEVAPFGHLVASERAQEVLVLSSAEDPRLTTTPREPVRAATWRTEIDGRITDDGTLEATVREVLAGDPEVLVRQFFRSSPRQYWDQVAAEFPMPQRQAGTITDLVPGTPEDTDAPFAITYRFVVGDYVDWREGRLQPPVNFQINVPTPDSDEPLDLTGLGEAEVVARIELPEDVDITTVDLPATELSESFGQFSVRVGVVGRLLTAARRLALSDVTIEGEDARKAYAVFVERVKAAPVSINVMKIRPWAWGDDPTIRWYDDLAGADLDVLTAATHAGRRRDYQEAIATLRSVLARAPDSDSAWMLLAWVYYESGNQPRALAVLKERLPATRSASLVKYFVLRLTTALRTSEIIDVLQHGHETFPDDAEIALSLADALIDAERFVEALDVLDAQRNRQAKSGRFHVRLADALIGLDRRSEAAEVLLRASEVDPGTVTLNEVAWRLADEHLGVNEAVDLASRAVATEVDVVNTVDLDAASVDHVVDLVNYWDTLGWALFRAGRHEDAERYLRGAWELSELPIHAVHLAELYEALGRSSEADQYRLEAEAATGGPWGGRTDRIGLLSGVRSKQVRSRTYEVAASGTSAMSFQALLLIGADGRVVESAPAESAPTTTVVRVTESLRGLTMPWRTPSAELRQILRRAAVSCASAAGTCTVVLAPAARLGAR